MQHFILRRDTIMVHTVCARTRARARLRPRVGANEIARSHLYAYTAPLSRVPVFSVIRVYVFRVSLKRAHGLNVC